MARDTRRQSTDDEQAAMAWWNGLTEAQRADWLATPGHEVLAQAWAAYQRELETGVTLEPRVEPPGVPERTTRRPIAELLERLSPDLQEEVRLRLLQGDIPYLPEDVLLHHEKGYFPEIGWADLPGYDPAKWPIDEIELLFLLSRGNGYTLEVRLKVAPPVSDSYKTLRKLAAFRTKNQLDRYIRKASPRIVAELRSRLKRGQLAFLPEQIQFEGNGIVLGGRFIEAPGVSPDNMTADDVVLAFVIPAGTGNMLEIVWRTQ
jgi:hypothetical protein